MTLKVGNIVKHSSGAIGIVDYVYTSNKYVKIKIINYQDKNTVGKLYDVYKDNVVKISISNFIKE